MLLGAGGHPFGLCIPDASQRFDIFNRDPRLSSRATFLDDFNWWPRSNRDSSLQLAPSDGAGVVSCPNDDFFHNGPCAACVAAFAEAFVAATRFHAVEIWYLNSSMYLLRAAFSVRDESLSALPDASIDLRDFHSEALQAEAYSSHAPVWKSIPPAEKGEVDEPGPPLGGKVDKYSTVRLARKLKCQTVIALPMTTTGTMMTLTMTGTTMAKIKERQRSA